MHQEEDLQSSQVMLEQLQRSQQPVDVVYLWVNGSDPELQHDLEHYRAVAANAAATAGRDGHYSSEHEGRQRRRLLRHSRSHRLSRLSGRQHRHPAEHVDDDTEGGDEVPPPPADPAQQSRFYAGKDELRYSLRSLEMYMPWYRRLFIVTNGEVGFSGAARCSSQLVCCLCNAGVVNGGALAASQPFAAALWAHAWPSSAVLLLELLFVQSAST